jgi:hypothetical protein
MIFFKALCGSTNLKCFQFYNCRVTMSSVILPSASSECWRAGLLGFRGVWITKLLTGYRIRAGLLNRERLRAIRRYGPWRSFPRVTLGARNECQLTLSASLHRFCFGVTCDNSNQSSVCHAQNLMRDLKFITVCAQSSSAPGAFTQEVC